MQRALVWGHAPAAEIGGGTGPPRDKKKAQHENTVHVVVSGVTAKTPISFTMRVELIGLSNPCVTQIYLHI